MSSRSLSPPGGLTRYDDGDEQSIALPRLPAPPPPFQASGGRPLSPPPLHASVVRGGPDTPPRLQHQEESGWEMELDSPISPPRIVFITQMDEEPGSPTSPPRPPKPPIDVNPAVLPKGTTLGYNTEECRSCDGEDDPYFKSLVDNFVTAAEDEYNYSCSEEEDIDSMKADHQRQSKYYAETALEHYNNDEKNKVKYELISAITSCGGIIDKKGCYGHVNFTAKGNQENSKEELFFAALCIGDPSSVPTCMVSLKGRKRVGGLRGSVYDKFPEDIGLPIDSKHCYACGNGLKHPKEGTLFEGGHVACSEYYYN